MPRTGGAHSKLRGGVGPGGGGDGVKAQSLICAQLLRVRGKQPISGAILTGLCSKAVVELACRRRRDGLRAAGLSACGRAALAIQPHATNGDLNIPLPACCRCRHPHACGALTRSDSLTHGRATGRGTATHHDQHRRTAGVAATGTTPAAMAAVPPPQAVLGRHAAAARAIWVGPCSHDNICRHPAQPNRRGVLAGHSSAAHQPLGRPAAAATLPWSPEAASRATRAATAAAAAAVEAEAAAAAPPSSGPAPPCPTGLYGVPGLLLPDDMAGMALEIAERCQRLQQAVEEAHHDDGTCAGQCVECVRVVTPCTHAAVSCMCMCVPGTVKRGLPACQIWRTELQQCR